MSEVRLSAVSTHKSLAPSPDDPPAFVPYACGQLAAPFTVKFKEEVQEEYVSKAEDRSKKTKKSTAVLTQLPVSDSNEVSIGVIATQRSSDEDEIVVSATLDKSDRLVELALEHCTQIPRLLMQVIGLCVPFCPFLTSLSLQLCRFDGTVLYEIAKLLPQSQITDLSLDDSRVVPAERCYYRLLEQSTKLRSLSLARCSLTDDDCALLVSKITFPLPASKTLMVLNLTNNFISDVGARSIGECLRSNRTLLYLNLAGNQIGDEGAAEIINSLCDFPLTADEILQKRHRYMEFLKMRQELLDKFYNKLGSVGNEKALDDSRSAKKRVGLAGGVKSTANTIVSVQKGKRNSRDVASGKVQAMLEELDSSYNDPFSSEETFLRDCYRYCIGNMALCYLNFAYNNLGYPTLKKLLDLLKYQSNVTKNTRSGLLQVQLQGNNMPECIEMYILEDWLEQAVMSRTARAQVSRRIKPKK